MTRPSRARRGDPERALLDAGRRLFARRGYEAVSIDEIAAEAGLAKGLLYYYFTGKRALYLEVVRAAGEELAARTAPDPDLPPGERTAAVLDAVIAWAKEYGESTRLLLAQNTGADPELRAIVQAGRDRQAEMMLDGLRRTGAELGKPPLPDTPLLRHAVHGWIAFIEAVLAQWLEKPDVSERELRTLFLHAAGGFLAAARRTNPGPTQ
ncbi:TetR/AcrR family transcriptional regulator [Amycolatopsis sp. 195334CR]|uniref:TetR/AcrR family transcriptional regulator n=1 Tax=Amycolatopsis sp. 195334CR TaxID=2814588 RepID=UPI001A8C18FB|nr:TetR/AcrR family transcriptional regulator [Amycolatopsis sp. 195334CR]MBN6039671.1 TetR/AcrR family transcriptional regulator [Amycolatopsis sp. 195334CR]